MENEKIEETATQRKWNENLRQADEANTEKSDKK